MRLRDSDEDFFMDLYRVSLVWEDSCRFIGGFTVKFSPTSVILRMLSQTSETLTQKRDK